MMKKTHIDRRKFLLSSGICLLTISQYQVSYAGRLKDAVLNFTEENYAGSIDAMTDEEIDDFAREVPRIERKLANADNDLRKHIEEAWSDENDLEDRHHTERCPYCISLAKEVEAKSPEFKPIDNKVPRCFIINHAGYISSDWGSLHRYYNGQVGPIEGSIWFKNGTYMARNAIGSLILAQPAC